ncbi:hypothetical protein GCM10010965_15730 [Caldalkalibacillus thermarum]|uniref:flavin reductase family protein n=1 Tax=Caldalkalibacillus thermarum TaxID=296745 RepID=UPI00166E798E|nr:flavin reductase family protein [Caldalkalibacillus thermarum]GGK23778.1 hypothetical protein GCM10010965_15730 [Caldalkalibacillus thermarum]
MFYEVKELSGKECYQLLNSLVTPRPIAWVSSLSAEGVVNLAPHSYFTVVCTYPPMIGFSAGGPKDTPRNILATKEFVVNVVTEELTERMNLTAVEFPPEVSELEEVGLTAESSRFVRVPRVKESPMHMECRLVDIHEYGPRPAYFIIGEVLAFHIDPQVTRNGKVDPALLKAVGRMGGAYYTRTTDYFELPRVSYEEYQQHHKHKRS